MSTWIWHALEIEPTTDVKVIKKAYATKAKRYHPEEYPEEYQNLQNAYKAAIQYAKQKKETDVVPVAITPIVPVASFTEEITKTTEQKITEQKTTGEKTTEQESTERKTSEEKTSEREITDTFHHDYKEIPTVSTAYYIYDDVNTEDNTGKFWRQLQYFIWHPYVRKEYDFWNYFMNRPHVREIMKAKEAQKNFLDLIQKENILWEKDVQVFLDSYFDELQENENKESMHLASSRMKPGFFRDFLGRTKYGYDTEAERDLFQIIWWRRDENERKDPKKYLDMYFEYAETNAQKLYAVHKEAHETRQKRTVRRMVKIIGGVIIVCICIYSEYLERQNDMSYQLERLIEQNEMTEIYSESIELEEEKNMDKLLEKVEEVAPSLIEHPELLKAISQYKFENEEQLVNFLKEVEKRYNESEDSAK